MMHLVSRRKSPADALEDIAAGIIVDRVRSSAGVDVFELDGFFKSIIERELYPLGKSLRPRPASETACRQAVVNACNRLFRRGELQFCVQGPFLYVGVAPAPRPAA